MSNFLSRFKGFSLTHFFGVAKVVAILFARLCIGSKHI